jgi:NADP-dependent 3-hydroxy acid dehydrogenase YdfG
MPVVALLSVLVGIALQSSPTHAGSATAAESVEDCAAAGDVQPAHGSMAMAATAATRASRYQPLDISGQTVLITGASAGIGAATAVRFAELGCKLVLVARREERLNQIKADLTEQYGVAVHTVVLDVADMAGITAMPAALPPAFAEIDILVNNAGFAKGVAKATENDIATIQAMMQVNVVALMAITKFFSPGMVARGRGHIINIGSIAGHEAYGGGSIYCATKFAVDAFTTSTRHDLVDTPVRVTAISPGAVNTDFSTVRYGDKAKADDVYTGFNPLLADDIADNVGYAATRPLNVQIADIVVLANAQSSAKTVSRGGTH